MAQWWHSNADLSDCKAVLIGFESLRPHQVHVTKKMSVDFVA
nr:MAG TPA: hypothetical protein [Caudoviricetes sp.]